MIFDFSEALMTHKVHPKIFRIGETTNWKSRWFNSKKYKEYLKEDVAIRKYLSKKLERLSVESIEIERSPNMINIIIYTSRPGLLIGRGGAGTEELKKQIQNKVFKTAGREKREIRMEIREIKQPSLSAAIVAQEVADKIEKRIPFRRVIKEAMQKIMENKEARGAKIKVSGRLDGAEIARRAFLNKGEMPLQTLRADIDYSEQRAYCTYGVIGIKVWIYKGEKLK